MVLPNLVVSKTVSRNRCDRFFSETVIPKIRVPEIGDSKNGVPKTVIRNRCFRFFLKRWSRKSVSPNLVVSKTVSRNRCSRFFSETVIPQIGVPEIDDPKSVFPFLGTILLHTLGFINRCPLVGLMSEKWTCNSSRQSFHQTKTLRRFPSSIASSPRLSSRNSREACRSVEHQGSKPIHHFLKTVVFYTPNPFL